MEEIMETTLDPIEEKKEKEKEEEKEEELYGTYERLLLKRDEAMRLAGAAQTAYVAEFGELITTSFQKKISCIEKKKRIAFCQRMKNCGKPIYSDELEAYLKAEMEPLRRQLAEMQEQYESCRAAGVSSEYDVMQAKKLYRKLARRIHPDIHPELQNDPVISDLWNRAVSAYGNNDPKELEEILVLAEHALSLAGIEHETVHVPDLAERIAALKEKLERILTTDPYLFRELLQDAEAVAEKKKSLQEEIEMYTEYEKELEQILAQFIGEGIRALWEKN